MAYPANRAVAGDVAPGQPEGQDPVNVRVLKWVVIVLGFLLAAAFVTVFAVIAYRLARPPSEAAPGEAAVELVVRPGTRIGQFQLEGNRLVLHLTNDSGQELAVVDVRSGKVLSRIRLRETPTSGN
jgi:hypothetical protein